MLSPHIFKYFFTCCCLSLLIYDTTLPLTASIIKVRRPFVSGFALVDALDSNSNSNSNSNNNRNSFSNSNSDSISNNNVIFEEVETSLPSRPVELMPIDIWSPDGNLFKVEEYLNEEKNIGGKEELRSLYNSNKPFPYIVIDNFLPDVVLSAANKEIPDHPEDFSPSSNQFARSAMNVQYNKWELIPTEINSNTGIRRLIKEMQTPRFIKFLEGLTGIEGLQSDHFLWGSGVHSIATGGHLSLHLDQNFNHRLNMWRRVNLFLYFNKDWDQKWGGELEFWDEKMQNKVESIAPLWNRMVVFTPSETSFHGHPDPLKCPPNRTRKSIALYYYTVHDNNAWKRSKRETDFRPRKNIDRWDKSNQFSLLNVNLDL